MWIGECGHATDIKLEIELSWSAQALLLHLVFAPHAEMCGDDMGVSVLHECQLEK